MSDAAKVARDELAERRARRRSRLSPSMEEAVRGAEESALSRPAGEFFASVRWAGLSPDPDVLDAATFLAWL